jgi:RNA polymerase sigma factor (sigma-70 family)
VAEYTLDDIIVRRDRLSKVFNNIPPYDSIEFWQVVEQADFPREVLVKILRSVHTAHNAKMISQRISSIIISDLQKKNESWAYRVLKGYPLGVWDVKYHLCVDLCADLNEAILKSIFDPRRVFWEENFGHCLYYERMHVLHSLMRREGHVNMAKKEKGRRIPRNLLSSLDTQLMLCTDGLYNPFELEDEQAYAVMHTIDSNFLIDIVKGLPKRLSVVVILVFWADKSERDTAELLSITERTVRNRLQNAIDRLTNIIVTEPDFLTNSHQYPGYINRFVHPEH